MNNMPRRFFKFALVTSALVSALVMTAGCGEADDEQQPTTDAAEADSEGADGEEVDSQSDALSKPFPQGGWNPNEGMQKGKPCGAKIKKRVDTFPCARGTFSSGFGFCVLVCVKPRK